MLQITFVDSDGEEGVMDSDLTLRYAGRYRDEMAAFVTETVGEDGCRPSPPVSLLQRFAVGLYTEFPLAEVELVGEEPKG